MNDAPIPSVPSSSLYRDGVDIVADSVSPIDGARLTTFRITIPKWIQAELNTHRMLSRNSASSRAIPHSKVRQQVIDEPVIPVWWGKAQPGMQAREELAPQDAEAAARVWLDARLKMLEVADTLEFFGLHKQIINRLIEPWMWVTVIVSATEWDNFFTLRCHPDAQPEFRAVAERMQELYDASTPNETVLHTPLADARRTTEERIVQSVARCARVSYNRAADERPIEEDRKMMERLRTSGHWSPFEHVAWAEPGRHRNFIGWKQCRQMIDGQG